MYRFLFEAQFFYVARAEMEHSTSYLHLNAETIAGAAMSSLSVHTNIHISRASLRIEFFMCVSIYCKDLMNL